MLAGQRADYGGRGNAGEVAASGAAAAQHDHLGIPSVLGDQAADPGSHLPPVADDVANKVPGDPVVHADRVLLAAAIPQPALADPGQAGPARPVYASHL